MTRIMKLVVLGTALSMGLVWMAFHAGVGVSASPANLTLSAPFERKILATTEEAPLDLRLFTTAVKTDSEGTITLDIDPTTGLIADPDVCPIIRSKTFIIGQEPRRYCGPQYHTNKTIEPSATRPRTVNP